MALAVPLSRFASQVGGGSAFYVDHSTPEALMNTCSYCGAKYPDEVVVCPIDHTRMVEEPASPDKKQSSVSAIPYALFVPVLVVMAHDAESSLAGWSFRNNALIAGPFPPEILTIMCIIALVSYFAIRPFANRAASRWAAFLSCVVFFPC